MGVPAEEVPSEWEVEEAARLANAHDFIMAMPQGYDTVCLSVELLLAVRMPFSRPDNARSSAWAAKVSSKLPSGNLLQPTILTFASSGMATDSCYTGHMSSTSFRASRLVSVLTGMDKDMSCRTVERRGSPCLEARSSASP